MLAPELQAANSLLKRGLRYKIQAPFFLKLLGKQHTYITITQLFAGTELRIAALLTEAGLTDELIENTKAEQLMIEHYKTILKAVAMATLNRKVVLPFAMWFRKRQLSRLSVFQLFELLVSIRQYSGVSSFTNITRLLVSTRITKPNLGQMQKGSQQVGIVA